MRQSLSGNKLYQNFIKQYIRANPNPNKEIQLSNGQKAWNSLKKTKRLKEEDRSVILREKINIFGFNLICQ